MNKEQPPITDTGDTLSDVREYLIEIHASADDPVRVRHLVAEALDLFDPEPVALH